MEKYSDSKMDAVAMDIEHFHLVNEIYGRAEGDRILKRIASMIMAELSDSYGIACRSAADTFYIYNQSLFDYEKLADITLNNFLQITEVPRPSHHEEI